MVSKFHTYLVSWIQNPHVYYIPDYLSTNYSLRVSIFIVSNYSMHSISSVPLFSFLFAQCLSQPTYRLSDSWPKVLSYPGIHLLRPTYQKYRNTTSIWIMNSKWLSMLKKGRKLFWRTAILPRWLFHFWIIPLGLLCGVQYYNSS